VDVQIGTKDRTGKGPKWQRSGPNWTSTSVLDSKRTEVARDWSGCTPPLRRGPSPLIDNIWAMMFVWR